jgi:hypothetical protein
MFHNVRTRLPQQQPVVLGAHMLGDSLTFLLAQAVETQSQRRTPCFSLATPAPLNNMVNFHSRPAFFRAKSAPVCCVSLLSGLRRSSPPHIGIRRWGLLPGDACLRRCSRFAPFVVGATVPGRDLRRQRRKFVPPGFRASLVQPVPRELAPPRRSWTFISNLKSTPVPQRRGIRYDITYSNNSGCCAALPPLCHKYLTFANAPSTVQSGHINTGSGI